MTYTVLVEQTTTGWSAYVPDLPGCVATARTRALVELAIAESIALHLDGMRADGEQVPAPHSYAVEISVAA